MLSKVVHRLKRRFRKKDTRDSQPPELRRWSNFMKPFPHVELGGYTRYYQNHGLSLDRSPVASAESSNPSFRRTSKPKAVLPPIQLPSHSSSTASEAPSPSSPGTNSSKFSSNASCSTCYPTSKVALIDIPEESATSIIGRKVHCGPPRAQNASEALGRSLKRRKLRILRTTSTENDTFWKHGSPSVAGSLSYTLSDESAVSNETKLDSPHTTMATLVTDLACNVYKIAAGGESTDYGDGSYERPDSRASFCTARSDFGD